MYLLDTNVFIETQKRYYDMEIVPGYWECLLKFNEQQRLLSIDRVRDEILVAEKYGNGLIKWVKQFHQPCSFFVSTKDNDVKGKLDQLMDMLDKQNRYTDEAITSFAEKADGWLVAYAQQYGHTVVTLESYDQNIAEKKEIPNVKIPNICEKNNVRCITPFAMLKSLGVKFVASYT